jgi:hypothetical protein
VLLARSLTAPASLPSKPPAPQEAGALAKQSAALRARHGIREVDVFDAGPTAPIGVKEASVRQGLQM